MPARAGRRRKWPTARIALSELPGQGVLWSTTLFADMAATDSSKKIVMPVHTITAIDPRDEGYVLSLQHAACAQATAPTALLCHLSY